MVARGRALVRGGGHLVEAVPFVAGRALAVQRGYRPVCVVSVWFQAARAARPVPATAVPTATGAEFVTRRRPV
jgi:hypothetical protein